MTIASPLSQRSTGGAHVSEASGSSATVASCKAANKRPTRSRKRWSSSRSRPVARAVLMILEPDFNNLVLPARLVACAHQVLQLSHELGNVFKLKIHRSEAHVSNFIEILETPHDHLTDLAGWSFALRRFLHIFFDSVDDRFKLRRWYGSLFASSQQTCHDF